MPLPKYLYRWSKVEAAPIGRVADLCPICGELTACRLETVRLVHRINFVAVSRGQLHGHQSTCETCGASWESDPGRFERIDGDSSSGVPDLHAHTRPLLDPALARRLDLQTRAPTELSEDERAELIEEAFVVFGAGVRPSVRVKAAADRAIARMGPALQRLSPSWEELREPARRSWRREDWLGEVFRDDDRRFEALVAACSGPARPVPEFLRILVKRLEAEGIDESRWRTWTVTEPWIRQRLPEARTLLQVLEDERKTVYRRRGRVADFCHCCRAIQPHTFLVEVARQTFPDSGEEVGHAVECEQCLALVPSSPELYERVDGDPDASVEALDEQTLRRLDPLLLRRLDLEDRRVAGALSPQEWWELLQEPIQLYHPGRPAWGSWIFAALAGGVVVMALPLAVLTELSWLFFVFVVLAFGTVAGLFAVLQLPRILAVKVAALQRRLTPIRALDPLPDDLVQVGQLLARGGVLPWPECEDLAAAREAIEQADELALPTGDVDLLIQRHIEEQIP